MPISSSDVILDPNNVRCNRNEFTTRDRLIENTRGHEEHTTFSLVSETAMDITTIESQYRCPSASSGSSATETSRTPLTANETTLLQYPTTRQPESPCSELYRNSPMTTTPSTSITSSRETLDSTSSENSNSSCLLDQEVREQNQQEDCQNTNHSMCNCSCFHCVKYSCQFVNNILRILFLEIVPWCIGCFVIFYAFKNGGLGLGFSAFLLLVSAHGIVKWWTTRQPSESAIDEILIVRRAEIARHHHHRHNDDNDSSDESILGGANDHNIRNEPPPSYEMATNPTVKDMSLGLDVHLTPTQQRSADAFEGIDKQRLIPHFIDSRRGSLLSAVSYYSSEVEDSTLPCYDDATRKTKRKKKRSSKRKHNKDSESSDLYENQNNSQNLRGVGIPDLVITVPLYNTSSNPELATTGNSFTGYSEDSVTTMDDVRITVGDNVNSVDNSSSCHPDNR